MDGSPLFVDSEEASVGDGVLTGDVVTIVGKAFAGGQPGRLADDALAFNHEVCAVCVFNDPFAAEQGDDAIGGVGDRDVVNERVRFAGGEV